MTLINKPKPAFRKCIKPLVKDPEPPKEESPRVPYFIAFSMNGNTLDNTFVSAKRPIKYESDIRALEKRLNSQFGTNTVKIINFKRLEE